MFHDITGVHVPETPYPPSCSIFKNLKYIRFIIFILPILVFSNIRVSIFNDFYSWHLIYNEFKGPLFLWVAAGLCSWKHWNVVKALSFITKWGIWLVSNPLPFVIVYLCSSSYTAHRKTPCSLHFPKFCFLPLHFLLVWSFQKISWNLWLLGYFILK